MEVYRAQTAPLIEHYGAQGLLREVDGLGTVDEVAARKTSALVYERLFIRHWDTWKDGRRSHLFVMPSGGGTPVDIMNGMDADCPSKPFGGPEEYAFAPDGASVVFSASSRSVETSPESGTDRCETGSRRSEDSSPRTTSPAGSESWTGMSGMLMPRMFRRVSSRGENDSAASVASTVVDSNGSSCCPTPEPCDTETSLYTRVTSDSL